MLKSLLKGSQYSLLSRGLLNYLNFSPAEKQQITNYLLGRTQAPVLTPKINPEEIKKLKQLLAQISNEYNGAEMQEWLAAKADDLKLLEEYEQFLKDGQTEKFLTRIYSHYGRPQKDLFHFHLNDLLVRANKNKRNKIILSELNGLLAREVAIDPSKHLEHEISPRTFDLAKKVFNSLYKPELKLLRQELKDFKIDDEYSAHTLCGLLNKLLEFYGLDKLGWKATIGKETDKVSVNRLQLEIKVSSTNFRFSRPRMAGLLLHEIGAHILAHPNILVNKKKYSVSPRALEEGLGVFLEQLMLRQPHHMRVYRYLAIGLALGVDGTPRDMKQVFEILWRLRYLNRQSSSVEYAKDYAIKEILRVFRGIPPTATGVVLTKDKVYLEGNHFIWRLAQKGDLELIFNGFLGKEIKDNIRL